MACSKLAACEQAVVAFLYSIRVVYDGPVRFYITLNRNYREPRFEPSFDESLSKFPHIRERGQVESAGKSRQRVGGESPPHGNG